MRYSNYYVTATITWFNITLIYSKDRIRMKKLWLYIQITLIVIGRSAIGNFNENAKSENLLMSLIF